MFGDVLRQERERQNLTIHDVEERTNIRTLYLEAIEAGNYKVVPGEVYLKGFIKSYATALGLDGAAMVRAYVEEMNPPAPPAEETAADGGAAEEEKPAAAKAPASRESLKVRRERRKNSRSGLVAALCAALLCAGAAGYWLLGAGGSGAVTEQAKAPVKAPAQSAAAEQSAEKPKAPAKAPAPPEKKQEKPVEITAKFSDRCWVSVYVDGKSTLVETVPAGKTLTWKADQEIKIYAGNAGAVEVLYNGKNAGKLGNAGEVVSLGFTKDGYGPTK